MKNNSKSQNAFVARNWLLIFFAGLIFIAGMILVVVPIVAFSALGLWVAVAMGLSGLTSMYFAYKAFITNDPVWILLDVIIPG